MEKTNLLETQYIFLDDLLEYKKLNDNLVTLVNSFKKNIERHQDWPYYADELLGLQFASIENMLSNKLTLLAKTFNQKGINMFYFQDPENGKVYASNFFCRTILRYYRKHILDFIDTINGISDSVDKFDKRIEDLFQYKFLKSLVSLLKDGKLYSRDQIASDIIDEIQAKYREYLNLQSDFYSTELSDEYINIVRYYTANILKSDKPFSIEELVVLYEIDCDFCRTFGCEKYLDEITKLYQECAVNKGYDASIIEDTHTRYFTKYVDPEFDPRTFISMNPSEIAGYKVLNDFSQANQVLKDLGLDLASLIKEEKKEDELTVPGEEGESARTYTQKKSIR